MPVTMHACEPRSKHCKNMYVSQAHVDGLMGSQQPLALVRLKNTSHNQLGLTCRDKEHLHSP